MNDTEEVTLEIEENHLKCKKKALIENSDYFKVMFEGNFMERHQSIIKLQDVDFKSLNIILTLLQDEAFIIEEEDLLLVLQTACMLQFDGIRSLCIEKVTEIMSLRNCLKIWHLTESLDLKPLYLKAKSLSLIEFPFIKDTDCILDLTVKQLHAYLANIFLCTKNEHDVFITCMRWWYENSVKESFTLEFADTSNLFFYFLTFMDFHSLSNSDIKEMMTYPDIADNDNIMKILYDIVSIRIGDYVECNEHLSKVNILLHSRRRLKNTYPCILIDTGCVYSCCTSNGSETFVTSNKKCSEYSLKNVMLFDVKNSNFKKLLSVPQEKHENLEGFQILGYKELIFLFGGEFYWGRGKWCDNFWVYDTIRERWERKTKMPYGRRHFESCIADNIVYIIGGTGNFRVLQDNMFWYSYKLDEWSKLINLPCPGRQIKCCEYKNQLFLLNISNKCGYLFNLSTSNWTELKICDTNGLVHNFPEKFVVFLYEDYLYIKGSSIIKLKIIDNKLEVISTTYLKPINFDSMESVLCNGILYTIYKRTTADINSVIFEKFDILNYISDIIMEYDTEATPNVDLCGVLCRFSRNTKLFSLSHYSILEEDSYLTDITL